MARKTSSKTVSATDNKEELAALWTAAHELLFAAAEGDGPMIHALPGESAEGDRQHADDALRLVETAAQLLKMAQSLVYERLS